jgi:hypothetical protein
MTPSQFGSELSTQSMETGLEIGEIKKQVGVI